MQKRREADAPLDSASRIGICRGKKSSLCVVITQLECAVHQPTHIHFFFYNLTNRQRLTLANEIPSPQFVRRNAHSLRHAIQVALQRENALRRAESSKSSMRRRIGRDGPAV